VTCSVHEACGSTNATDSSTKSCIYTLGGFSGIDGKAKCPAEKTCESGNGHVGHATSAAAAKPSVSMIIIFIVSCIIIGSNVVEGSSYSTPLVDCGSPSNPSFTDGHQCTGCSFTAVDINSFNLANNAAGCVAGLSGMYAGSSAAKGYHCLTVKNTANGGVTCSVHAACGSTNATDSSTKSCIYTLGGFSGIDDTAKCPEDKNCESANGVTSSASPAESGISIIMTIAIFLSGISNSFK